MKYDACFYHANCLDGFGAAWAAKKMQLGLECLPIQYGNEEALKDCPKGKRLLFVDYCPKPDILLYLCKYHNHVTVIDHHQTAEGTLDRAKATVDNLTVVFDQGRSGCTLTWKHFFPNTPVPEFLLYIEDRDLWTKNLRDSDAITSAIYQWKRGFYDWDELADTPIEKLYVTGNALVSYREQIIDRHIETFRNTTCFDGFIVPIINTMPTFVSEIGHILCKGHPFAVMYCLAWNKIVVSLRSEEGGEDVAKIAEKFGGGGHKHAAGFNLELGELKDTLYII